MGAASIEVYAHGKDIKEAFRNAVDEATREYGYDPYNGEINNCELMGDITYEVRDMHQDDRYEYAIGKTSKRQVVGWCVKAPVENRNKSKTKVERFPQKGKREWETYYGAIDQTTGKVVVTATKLDECIAKAREHVEKFPDVWLDIQIGKRLKNGSRKCAEIRYKPSNKERDGEYVFVGWAPC